MRVRQGSYGFRDRAHALDGCQDHLVGHCSPLLVSILDKVEDEAYSVGMKEQKHCTYNPAREGLALRAHSAMAAPRTLSSAVATAAWTISEVSLFKALCSSSARCSRHLTALACLSACLCTTDKVVAHICHAPGISICQYEPTEAWRHLTSAATCLRALFASIGREQGLLHAR